MARLVAAAATSHAFALLPPENWDRQRESNRMSYARRFNTAPPPEQPMVAQETDEDIQSRYRRIRDTHDQIRQRLANAALDALVVIGDDQNENFTEQTYLPQLAIYTGPDFHFFRRDAADGKGALARAHPGLARHLLIETVNAGFDTVDMHVFLPDGLLRAHAIGPVVERLSPSPTVSVIPIFVEGIHMPAPSPKRCYDFGRALAAAIGSWPGGERIGVIASGGLSHVTAGYPYASAPSVAYGEIYADFDRQLVERMEAGRGEDLSLLTNEDLLRHGDIELRSWLTLLGMVGDTKTSALVYEPFYRGIMAMAAAYWDLERVPAATR